MTESRFLQVHTLTSYSGVLLNRDDVGFAKRIPFGGVTRTRVSSQCLKKHWRQFEGDGSLASIGPAMSIRSRRTFDEMVFKPLLAAGVAEGVARAATDELQAAVLGTSSKKAAAKTEAADEEPSKDGDSDSHTGQITVLGRPEMEFLVALARKICEACAGNPKRAKDAVKSLGKDGLDNLRAIKLGAGLDAALFGRMVTGDVLARCDAAIHVAHAFTVHAEQAENDYFAAVDDLVAAAGEEAGSGHIGTNELTSGLFYGYAVIDVPLLVSNLEGCAAADWRTADRSLAAEVVRRLVRLIATVSPGAKLGSTAPYAYASFVGVEAGAAQPRSLANAFLAPTRTGALEIVYRALSAHWTDLDAMYGHESDRSFAGLEPTEALGGSAGERRTVADLARWASEKVRD